MARVYVPATLTRLAAMRDGGALPVPGAFAVTPDLRRQLALPAGPDVEDELAEAALVAAADASLRLLADEVAADPGAPRRRVVVAADVPAGLAGPPDAPERHPAAVVPRAAPLRADIRSLLVDDAAAEPVVTAVVAALTSGDDQAYEAALDELDGHSLSWYDASELDDLAHPGPARVDEPNDETTEGRHP